MKIPRFPDDFHKKIEGHRIINTRFSVYGLTISEINELIREAIKAMENDPEADNYTLGSGNTIVLITRMREEGNPYFKLQVFQNYHEIDICD